MATLLVVGALFPMSASAQDDRGSCFRESGDKAISACNRAIKANPKDAQAYYSRGVEWRKKGQYGKAIADYSEAIRQDPTYVNAYYNRGIAWSNTGDSAARPLPITTKQSDGTRILQMHTIIAVLPGRRRATSSKPCRISVASQN